MKLASVLSVFLPFDGPADLPVTTAPPYRVAAQQAFLGGATAGDAFSSGQEAGDTFLSGQEAGCGNG